jgi:hypothetical protein
MRPGRARIVALSDLYRTDDENVKLVVVPDADDPERVVAARDSITGLPR